MSNKENIEKIFKDQFEDFKQTPPSSVWSKIEQKMFFKHFLRYKVLSINLWNVIAVVAIATSAIIFTNKPDTITNKDSIDNTNEIKFANKSEKSVIINSNTNYEQSSKTTIKTKTHSEKKQNSTTDVSENQISDKENVEVNPYKLLKENYVNSESINEGQITVKLAEPHSEFSVSTESACEPVIISFINTSENCDSYHWDFGNGETSSQKNPNFVFRTAGTFNVTLTVTSGRFSDSKTKKITIFSKPNADFEISRKSKNLFKGDNIEFSNNSTNFSKCIWKFGDKKTSSFTNPSHIYDTEGNYKISLICISDKKCADTAFLSNVLIQNPKYKISFPTAFSPDKSGQSNQYWKNSSDPNTIFHPVINTEISNYRLRIYNKYGALVFESNNIDIGWNGFYKNSPSPIGVYVWECIGKFENGKLFKETGNVTLLYLRNQ